MTRRLIVHAGFHRTGTSAAQAFLQNHRKHIYPKAALLLPRELRARDRGAVSRLATRASRSRKKSDLVAFQNGMSALLAPLAKQNRPILISDENLAGHMPGMSEETAYGTTPALMAALCRGAQEALGPCPIELHFGLREMVGWAKSAWAHGVFKHRLTLDLDAFLTRMGPVNFADVIQEIAQETAPFGTISITCHNGEEVTQALLDRCHVALESATDIPRVHASPEPDVLGAALEINRSAKSDAEVMILKDTLRAQ